MPKVKFLGASSREDETEAVEVDNVRLEKGGDAVEVNQNQLARLRDLPGLRFSVEGEKEAK